jgi:hypothetical protein
MAAKTKKPAGAAKTPPADNSREALAKELRSLIPRLDAEGLQFLIEQARVHLYNMQVDELNQTMERAAGTKNAKPKKAAGKTAKTAAKQAGKDELRIEGSESGSSFYIVYRGQYVMFSRDEIAQMVRIVSAPVTELERQEHLLGWFERERPDLFSVVPVAGRQDQNVTGIAALLRKGFRIPE